jgi:hypothetical protein
MSHTHDPDINNIPSIIVAYLFNSSDAPDHNHLWSQVQPEEAPLIRAALVRASSFTTINLQSDEAYLRGISDALAYMRELKLMNKFLSTSNSRSDMSSSNTET